MAERDVNEILIELRAENIVLKDKLNDSKKEIDKLGTHTEKASNKMGMSFKKILGFVTAYLGVKTIKTLVNLAEQVESVGGSFQSLATHAKGGSDGLLKAMQTASKGTVSNMDIMKSSSSAMLVMGESVANSLPKLMQIAAAAANASGASVKDTFDNLVVAAESGNTKMLRTVGLSTVEISGYVDNYAASLGKTSEQLTAAEKKQAYLNGILQAGEGIIKKLGSEEMGFGEKLQVMNAKLANAGEMIATTMLPALDNLIVAFLDVDVTGSSLFGDLIKGAAHFINKIAYAIKIVKIWADNDTSNQKALQSNIDSSIARYKKFQVIVQDLAEKDARYKKGSGKTWNDMVRDIRKATDEFKNFKTIQKVLDSGVFTKDQIYSAQIYVTEMEEATDASNDLGEATKSYATRMAEAEKQFNESEKQIDTMSLKRVNREIATQTAMTNAAEAGAAARQALQDRIQYEEYNENFIVSDLLKEQEKYDAIMEIQNKYNLDSAAVEEAYSKKKLIAENEARNKKLEAETNYYKAKMGMMSVEWKTLESITSQSSVLMSSSNKKLFNLGKALAYAQAVMFAAQAIVTAWAQGGVWGFINAAIVGAATAVQLAKIKNTKLPSYEKGFVPVLASGYVPQDHYPALIGTREAVITKQATAANSDILSEMNRTGKRASSGEVVVHQSNVFSGNVMDKEFINNKVIPELKNQARYMGKDLFAERKR